MMNIGSPVWIAQGIFLCPELAIAMDRASDSISLTGDPTDVTAIGVVRPSLVNDSHQVGLLPSMLFSEVGDLLHANIFAGLFPWAKS